MPKRHARVRPSTAHASEEAWTPADLAALRAMLYRVAAVAFLSPEPARLTWLRQIAKWCQQFGSRLALFPFFCWWSRLFVLLRSDTEVTLAALQEEYVQLFPSRCPLYESWYLVQSGAQRAGHILRLQETYRQAGLALDPTFGESPDHLSVELEFMATLCSREAEGWQGREMETVHYCLRQERAFLTLHLGQWIRELAREIRAHCVEPFYATLAEASAALVVHDQDLTRALQHAVRW